MAHFIYSRAENILSKLKNFPVDQSMEYTMLSLKAILLNAEEKQEVDPVLQSWLKELQNVFYQIEDSMDEQKWEVSKQEGTGKKVSAPFLCSNPIVAHKSLSACKMKELCDNLVTTAAKMYGFHLTEKHTANTKKEITHSFLSATEVSTRLIRPNWQLIYPSIDAPKINKKQCDDIVNDFNNIPRQVLFIVGDAGIGKSTLAKFIYNHGDVVKKFSLRLWVCVKEDFDTHRLIKEIYSFAIGKETYDGMTENQLLSKVQRYLRGETFLLVFQDLSIKNLDNCSMFIDLFKNVNRGSKIIVTTQSQETAEDVIRQKNYVLKYHIDSSLKNSLLYQPTSPGEKIAYTDKGIVKVKGLSYENSLSLLEEYAFTDIQKPRDLELTEVEEEKLISFLKAYTSRVKQEPRDPGFTEIEVEKIISIFKGSASSDKQEPRELEFTAIEEKKIISSLKYYGYIVKRKLRDPELTAIETEIVKKCNGVPLALKCVGSLLSSKTRIAEWKNVKDRLEKEGGGTLPILKLCYNLMPSHLKPCFLLCSQLPNDRIVSSNDAIQLWIAHGLLYSPQETNLSTECIGEKYFKELWSRCFVQDIEEYGLGYWFKMHPLIRKLSCTLAKEQAESPVVTKPVTEIRSIEFRVRNLVPPSASLADTCISKFKYLRILYLVDTNLQEISNAIGTLKYLKYLDLQGNKKIKRLPNSICDLQSLRTLILASCSALEELPKDIRNLIRLRYLWVTTDQLHLHKNGVGSMTSLRFLAIGGCDNLQNLFERSDGLACLKTLMIYDCKTLKSLPNEIGFLKTLENLVIWSCKKLTLTTLKEVQFKLQRFTIRDLPKVDELPQWLGKSTESLRLLEIINCPIKIEKEKFDAYEALESTRIYGCVKIPTKGNGLYRFSHQDFASRGATVDSRNPREISDNQFDLSVPYFHSTQQYIFTKIKGTIV